MIKIRHLWLDDTEEKAYLMRYDIKLSPTEYRILRSIALCNGISTDTIIEQCKLGSVARGNVAVHICSINRKAESISERKLVNYGDHRYTINQLM
jgi:DNA-binding MarR family transcriptional regulator